MLIAMTIFILSEAEDRNNNGHLGNFPNLTGTNSIHFYNEEIPISISTRSGLAL